jgi:3-methyladenine DNA glycosylase AlkD
MEEDLWEDYDRDEKTTSLQRIILALHFGYLKTEVISPKESFYISEIILKSNRNYFRHNMNHLVLVIID